MNRAIRWAMATGAAVATCAGVGCQTYQVGQVLPSGYHLNDDVDYHPTGPEFPLRNELNSMSQAEVEFRGTEEMRTP